MGTFLAIIGMFASGCCVLFLFVIALARALRKGYQAGTIAAILIIGLMLGILFTLLVAGDLVSGYAQAALASLFILLPSTLALLMLPRRKPRRIFTVQRVTFPYATIGQVIFIIGCVATAILSPLSWWTGGPWWLALVILVCGLIMAAALGAVLKAFGQPVRAIASFADLLAPGHRRPVIFMRAFDREGAAFVRSDDFAKYSRYSRPNVALRAVLISLDDYLKPAIESRIGPFLALGNPQDYFTPSGALRAYFKDETWMHEFREVAQHAACFLVETGASSNLRWELQYLRQSNLHDRLVVVAEHPTRPYDSYWIQLAARMTGVAPVSWGDFAATLKELGYQVSSGEPETGSVIGFDSEARAQVITSDADLPDEFVEPIEAWLNGHRDLSRCVELACTKCGRMVFKKSGTPPDTFACHTCRGGSPATRAALDLLRVTAWWVAVPVFIGILLIPGILRWTATWMFYAWFAFVIISAVFLWHIACAVGRRIAVSLGR